MVRLALLGLSSANLVKYDSKPFNVAQINVSEVVFNENSHLCSLFKDILIFEEKVEFLSNKLSSVHLKRALTLASQRSDRVYPNYSAIDCSLLLLKNILRKTKLCSRKQQKKAEFSSNILNFSAESVDVKSIEKLVGRIEESEVNTGRIKLFDIKLRHKGTKTSNLPSIRLKNESTKDGTFKTVIIKRRLVKKSPFEAVTQESEARTATKHKLLMTTRHSKEMNLGNLETKRKLRKGGVTERKNEENVLKLSKLRTILKKKLKLL